MFLFFLFYLLPANGKREEQGQGKKQDDIPYGSQVDENQHELEEPAEYHGCIGDNEQQGYEHNDIHDDAGWQHEQQEYPEENEEDAENLAQVLPVTANFLRLSLKVEN